MNLDNLYSQAIAHRQQHDCSAYPYENYAKLFETIQRLKPQTILEIGTGMGFSAAVLALAMPNSHITTIEADSAHAQSAQQFLTALNLHQNLTIINHRAETYLPTLTRSFDFVFFDGYQIHYELLPHYERLLKPGGVLFLANNQLHSKTSAQFFREFANPKKWRVLEQFADTTISEKI
jgi:predicted O-methyltransferase YrrM